MGKTLNGLNLCGLHPYQDSANNLRTIFPRLLENPGRRFECLAPPVLPTRRSGRKEFCAARNCRLAPFLQDLLNPLTLKASQQIAQGNALGKPNQIMHPPRRDSYQRSNMNRGGYGVNSQWHLSLQPPTSQGFREQPPEYIPAAFQKSKPEVWVSGTASATDQTFRPERILRNNELQVGN